LSQRRWDPVCRRGLSASWPRDTLVFSIGYLVIYSYKGYLTERPPPHAFAFTFRGSVFTTTNITVRGITLEPLSPCSMVSCSGLRCERMPRAPKKRIVPRKNEQQKCSVCGTFGHKAPRCELRAGAPHEMGKAARCSRRVHGSNPLLGLSRVAARACIEDYVKRCRDEHDGNCVHDDPILSCPGTLRVVRVVCPHAPLHEAGHPLQVRKLPNRPKASAGERCLPSKWVIVDSAY